MNTRGGGREKPLLRSMHSTLLAIAWMYVFSVTGEMCPGGAGGGGNLATWLSMNLTHSGCTHNLYSIHTLVSLLLYYRIFPLHLCLGGFEETSDVLPQNLILGL